MVTEGAQTGQKHVVLHVGCGPKNPAKLYKAFRTGDWRELRLDVNPDVEPDIVGSMTDMSMITDASVDAVWSSHNLEHLYAHEVPVALAEFFRVLKPGGFALMTLPDLGQVAELVAADKLDEPAYVSPAGPIAPLDMIYGHRRQIAEGNVFMAHRTGFTPKTLGDALQKAGFSPVRVRRGNAGQFDLWAHAIKPAPATPSD